MSTEASLSTTPAPEEGSVVAAPLSAPEAPPAAEPVAAEPVAAEPVAAEPAAAEAVSTGPATVVRVSDYKSDRTFADFPISPEVLQGLTALGYQTATPVQAATIEPGLAGKDLLVRAKTGTGKTCAFCVPMIERIPAGARKPRGLVLAPTRELALQVAQECAEIAKFKDLRICAIYGGVGFGPQEQALKDGAEIIVGTPGRLLDHIRRGNLDLSGLMVAALDEADEMLSMGFLEDVRKILDRAPASRQTLLFSATVNDSIKGLIGRYLKDHEEILLSYDGDNVSSVAHILYETSPDYHKARALLDLLELERPQSAIIFCNTREDVSTVCTYLDRQGMNAEMISGDLPQNKRERVMARVKAGAVQFLVATDVAARGIDISDLSHVINYALPDDAAVYTHRIGRTGRIGKTGTAITLAGGQDFSTRLTLERQHKIVFTVKELPTPEESRRLRTERLARTLKDASGTMAYEGWLEIARTLKERPDADTLLAVMIRAFFQWDGTRRRELVDRTLAPEGGEQTDGTPSPERYDAERGDRNDRPRRDGDRPRRDEGRRDEPRRDDGRREGRSDRGDRGPRPGRDGDRPARVEGDRPPRVEGDRPPRVEGDRPARAEGDRPARTEGERPARDGERRDRGGERGGERRDRNADRPRRERRDGAPSPTPEAPPSEEGVAPAQTPPAPTDAPVPAAADRGPADDAEEEDTEEVNADGSSPSADGDAAKKRKRRRRRRRKSGGGESGAGETGGGESGSGESGSGESGGGESGGGDAPAVHSGADEG